MQGREAETKQNGKGNKPVTWDPCLFNDLIRFLRPLPSAVLQKASFGISLCNPNHNLQQTDLAGQSPYLPQIYELTMVVVCITLPKN